MGLADSLFRAKIFPLFNLAFLITVRLPNRGFIPDSGDDEGFGEVVFGGVFVYIHIRNPKKLPRSRLW